MKRRRNTLRCYINDEGKITIPKHIRTKYKMSPNEYMEYELHENGIFIRFVEREEGRKHEQISIDEIIEKKEDLMQNGKSPVRTCRLRYEKAVNKCTLCGCLHGLIIEDGAAFCGTCLERKRSFDKQFKLVEAAAKQIKYGTKRKMGGY